jgi:hypothetical protein
LNHRCQPVIGSVLARELPTSDLFNHRLVIRKPRLHLIEAMVEPMQDIGEKQLGQLPIAESLPVSMRFPEGVDLLLHAHLIQPMQEKRNLVHPLDPLLHAVTSPNVLLQPSLNTSERECPQISRPCPFN